MSEPHIELLTPGRDVRMTWYLGIAMAAMAIYFAMEARHLSDQISTDHLRQEQLNKLARPVLQVKPSREKLDEQKRWAALSAERTFDWYPVFAGLESSSEADIELLEFVPDKTGRKMVLRGEARNIEALTDYMERLSSQPVFTHVYLVYEKARLRGTLALVEFEIRMEIVASTAR
ncbi:MAG: PilN domain-containing protein [Duganella sp.]